MRYSYKVTLLADVVMSSLSSTEMSESLDYLSGSAFMGIAANYLFTENRKNGKNYDVFDAVFSGKIRFLDAHPLIDGKRSFKIPLCLHRPKVKEMEEFYRFDGKPVPRKEIYPDADPKDTIQMKQIRSGFFTAEGRTWKKVEPEHQYTMKSSYDKNSRRAEKGALFGYDALVKGSEWVFVMEFDDEKKEIAEELNKFFTSKNHRIGKSKTSQYGNVKIDRDDSLVTDCEPYEAMENKYKVYADSRLCFFDENGQPTFQPTAEQLGFKEGEILWNESFVRKYVFTPRNAARNAYDGDIACIDKGSVFTVKSERGYNGKTVVGEYQSTGLGQIIVNPDFLENAPKDIKDYEENINPLSCTDPLIAWLESKQQEKTAEQEIAEQVTNALPYVPKEKNKLTPSQWGVLRAKARTAVVEGTEWENFESEIFNKKDGYLFKKRLNDKWGKHINRLKNIVDVLHPESKMLKHWNDIQKLRFFELLCATAAKDAAKKSKDNGGK